MFRAIVFCLLLVVSAIPCRGQNGSLRPDDWPQFRGPAASGVAKGKAPPVSWDLAESRNIAWKTEIPGLGFASPIICRDQVIIVTAVGEDEDPSLRTGLYGDIASVKDEGPQSWQVYSLSLTSGKVLWKRVLHYGPPRFKRHTKSSHANATPSTDGKHLIVSLASEGLYCLDLRGNLLWELDLGELDSGYFRARDAEWGFASSPIIYGDSTIILADIQKDSFLASFDVRTGREEWRVAREDVPTWGTPAIVAGSGSTELVVNGYEHSNGYDPKTGRELWSLSGGGDIPVPTPILGHGLVYLSSAHGKDRPLRAIRPGARGDISLQDGEESSEALVWNLPKDGVYLQTPIIYGPNLYACRGNGILSCYNAKTGERLYRERLGGGRGFTSSPVAADGQLYFTSEEGEVFVVRAGDEFELLATNLMKETCLATPAISKGIFVLRTKNHVYGIQEKSDRFYHVDSIVQDDRKD